MNEADIVALHLDYSNFDFGKKVGRKDVKFFGRQRPLLEYNGLPKLCP